MSAEPISRREHRAEALRRGDRRSTATAAVSTIIVIGGGLLLLTTRSGWPVVQETFFSAEAFRTSFPDILRGFWIDVKLFLVVEVLALIASLCVAILRSTRAPARLRCFPFVGLAPAFESLRQVRSPERVALVACRRTGDVAERLKAPACYEGTGPTVVGGKRSLCVVRGWYAVRW
jgi:hypothetical protein